MCFAIYIAIKFVLYRIYLMISQFLTVCAHRSEERSLVAKKLKEIASFVCL